MDLGIAVVGPRWKPPRATFIAPADWHPVGESLWCCLNKLAVLNHFTGTEIRRTFLASSTPGQQLSLSAGREWNAEAIADALNIDKEDVALSMVSNYSPEHWGDDSACRLRSPLAWMRLRYCQTCLIDGFHSPLHQLKRLDRCPWHGQQLRDTCPSCGEATDYALGTKLPWHGFACRCGHQWPVSKPPFPEPVELYAQNMRTYVHRVRRIWCADDLKNSWGRSSIGRPIPNVEHRFIDSLMVPSSYPSNLLIPLHSRVVDKWDESVTKYKDRILNNVADDVLNGWIVKERGGNDAQRGISLMHDAVTSFRNARHFIRRIFVGRPGLPVVRSYDKADICWDRETILVEQGLDCRQKAYVLWLATLPMFVPIEERIDIAQSPWRFGFSRSEFLQYWLDLAASVIVNSGYDMTLRLPIARWLVTRSLRIDLVHRYLNWLRFCAKKHYQDTFKLDDWKRGCFGAKHQLLVASSESDPPVILEFSESRLKSTERRIVTTKETGVGKSRSAEAASNKVFAAVNSSLFRY